LARPWVCYKLSSVADEADFRRKLIKALRQRARACEYLSSMNRAGVPDVHLVHQGRAYWLELKYAGQWPARGSSNVLAHRFSSPQLAFLRRVERAGGRGHGVIGFKSTSVAVIAVSDISDDGTVSRDQLEGQLTLDLSDIYFADSVLTLLARS
jgi:hypothetical protein